ncbi:ABC transporter permease [Pelagibacterium halotolerans]|uniref:Putative transport system permease abc transporter protein n=1 Tax=Pelagibacterium halotolerans (strain DSM 22347 / JCM 15775 / CGMCC 1.7692 / B2) TaxID=1082931 RepID=G4R7N1_PELHB|nr:ABC transporter permease subunit [Pelagibacterium halotolerans]AEQ53291.1 putative transport system permease abc transporter protein [Pelagibacterium halotolerans B2]QJR17092.1 ABC transporter permease subunit [Pelagibacterium halotolerans]SEA99182.1 NitT/TauT family transport system permease protein [Pelagibacterium halotolerans]
MTINGFKLPKMAALVVWLVVWEIVGQFDLLMLFPPFSSVVMAMGEVVTSRSFGNAVWITLSCYAMGMGLALVVGITTGILMGLFKPVDDMLNMWVNVFLSAPLSALVPIFMILFGLGTPTVVVTVFMFAVWIIVLDTRAGVQNISPSLLEMSHSFGANRLERARIVLLAALPEILAGIRLGMVRGVKGVVIGQLLVSIIGVGALFALYQQNFLMSHFWALIVLLFTFALTMADLIGRLEKRIEYYAHVRS